MRGSAPERLSAEKAGTDMVQPLNLRLQEKALLARRVMSCRACPGLNVPGSTEAAPAYGSVTSPVMFVGQSMHAWNPETPDRQIPFLNQKCIQHAGTLLFRAIHEAGYKYRDVFTTNAVHCHPPGNRELSDDEIRHCRHWLVSEVLLVRPCLIIALGSVAARVLNIPVKGEIQRVRINAKPPQKGLTTWGTFVYHPAYLLRAQGTALVRKKAELWQSYIVYLLRRFMPGDTATPKEIRWKFGTSTATIPAEPIPEEGENEGEQP